MTDLSNKTVCIVDSGGIFHSLAMHLSGAMHKGGFGRVLYYTPSTENYLAVGQVILGDGFGEFGVERCDDYMLHVHEIDEFVFTNLGNLGAQLLLGEMGKRVIGAGKLMRLEAFKSRFRALQETLGMDVPKYVPLRGLSALRKHLDPLKDKYVKTERFRRDAETFHWIDAEQSSGELDRLAVKFGPLQEYPLFLVEDAIHTDLEIGSDGLYIDGQAPSHAIQGVERKDLAYVSFIQPWEELDETIRACVDPLLPIMADAKYRTFFSTEQRVTRDANVLNDPTMRPGFPSGACQFNLYDNLPELIWEGGAGNRIPIEPAANVAVEILAMHDGDYHDWRSFGVPEEALPWVNFRGACLMGQVAHVPPDDTKDSCVASVSGIGKTVKEAYDHACETIDLLEGRLTFRKDAVADLIKEIEEAKSQDIDLAQQEMPQPKELLPG